jgi:hypothetical protein
VPFGPPGDGVHLAGVRRTEAEEIGPDEISNCLADEELYKAGFVMDALATDGATRGGTYNSLAVAAAAAAGVVTLASARSKEAAYSLLSACMRRNVTSKIPMFACIDGR